MSQIHILDKASYTIKDVLSNKAEHRVVLQDTHKRNIETYSETYDFIIDYRASEGLENRDRVLIPDEIKGYYREFIINKMDTDTSNGETEVYSEASYFEDLQKAKPIAPHTLDQATPKSAVEFALTGTGWELGEVEYSGFRTISWTSYNTPFEVLKILANRFEAQLDFSIETRGNKVTKRLVHLRQPSNLFGGKEIRRGKDLEDLQRSTLSTDIVTALIALGPSSEENEDRLILEIKDDEAQAKFGKTYNYLWGLYEPESSDESMTEGRLRTLATTELNKRNKPQVEYTINAVSIETQFPHEKVLIGDKIRLKDDLNEPFFYVDATIKEVTRSVFNPQIKSYVLGEITEHERIDLRKYFQEMLGTLRERLKNTNSNLDNIVTIIDQEVERRIHRGDTPPDNPINGQLWMDTSDRDRVIIKEYFNGEWIERITNVHDAEDIGAITREQAMYEAVRSAFENFKVLHAQLLAESLTLKDSKYINVSHINSINTRLQQVIQTYELIRDELDKYKDAERISLDTSNYLHQLMLDYSAAVSALRTTLQEVQEFAMAHLAYLQSQYTEEKYNEAMTAVADKFGLSYKDGILLGNAVLMSDLENTKNALQKQLSDSNTTLTDMIDSITGDSRNMLIGTSLIDPAHFTVKGGHTLLTDEPLEYVRIHKDSAEEKVNMIDASTLSAGTRIHTDGTESLDAHHTTTDFIPVKSGTLYHWATLGTHLDDPRIICYNDDQEYIEGMLYDDTQAINFAVSAGISYVRLTAATDIVNNEWEMMTGTYIAPSDTDEAYILFHNRMDYKANETYTLALDFRSDVVDELDYIFLSTDSAKHLLHDTMTPAPFNLKADGQWSRYYMQFTPTEDIAQAQFKIGTDYTDDVVGDFDLRQIHLYKGTNETSWLPAPEDNRQFITQLSREITDLEHKLSSKLSRDDYDVLEGRISSLNTEVSQTAEAITRKADKSVVDTINESVTNHSTKIEETAEGVQQLITKTNTQEGKLTTVTNKSNETAEGLEQTITKVETAEGNITQAQADIKSNTQEISNKLSTAKYNTDQEGVVQKLEMADSERIQLASEIQDRVTIGDYNVDKQATAGVLNTLETSITQNGKDIALRATKAALDGVDKTLSKSHAELKLAHDAIKGEVKGLSDNLTEVSTTVTQNKDSFDVSVRENTTKFSKIDDNLTKKVGKTEVVASINASTEGVKISGDKVAVTAGSEIKLAIDNARAYAKTEATAAENAAKAADTKAANAHTKIDGLKVSGRNLLLKSGEPVSSSSYNIQDYYLTEAIPEGTEVTVTFKARLNDNKSYFRVYNSGGNVSMGPNFTPKKTGEFEVHTATFNWKVGSSSNDFLRIYHMPSNISGLSTIEWIKLETGNMSTGWSQAPEEIVEKQKVITEINLDKSGVQIQGDKIKLTAGSEIKLAIDGAVSHTNTEVQAAKKHADTVAKAARDAAESYAKTKAESERVLAEIHADGKVTAEEQARIKDVNAKLETAKKHANTTSLAAETASKAYADTGIANIEIGGRNLYANSSIIKHKQHNSHIILVPAVAGQYTISFGYTIIDEVETITSFLLYSSASGVGSFARVPLKKAGEDRTQLTFNVTDKMIGSTIALYAGTSAAISRANTMDFIEVMLEKGNKASAWVEAQEDTIARIAATNKELADVKASLTGFEGVVNSTFKDGIIETAEAKAINSHKAQLSKEKADVDKKYTTVYGNSRLTGTPKTNLLSAKNAFNTSHNNLIAAINTVIADGKATTAEYNTVMTRFTDYETKLATLTLRFEEANDSIGTVKASTAESNAKSHADTAADNAKKAAEAYAKTKAEAERVLAEAYADGVVTEEEKARIKDVNAKLETAKTHANTKASEAQKAATAVANTKVAPAEVIPSINLDKSGVQIDGKKIALSAGSAIKLAIDAAEKNAEDHADKAVDDLVIGGTNLIPKTDFEEYIAPPNGWTTWGSTATLNTRIQHSKYLLAQNNALGNNIGINSDRLIEDIIEGQTYTLSFIAITSAQVNTAMNYTYLINEGGTNSSFPTPKREFIGNVGNMAAYKYTTTRVAPFGGPASILFGSTTVKQGVYGYIYISQPQLEIGSKATAWSKAHRDSVSKERIISEINLDKSGTKISGDMVDINANKINFSANDSFKLVVGNADKALKDALAAQNTANAAVPKTGVVSAINATRETVKISADKLALIGGKSISIRLNDADKAASNAQSTANTANKKANDVGDELSNLDAAGTNMLQHTNFSDLRNINKMGAPWGSGASYSRSSEYILVTTSNSGSQLGMRTMDDELYFEPNTQYTLSFKAYSSGYTTGDFNYVYIYRPDGSNEGSFHTKRVKLGDAPQAGYTLYEYRVTFTSTKDHDKPAQMLIADTTTRTGASTWVRIKDIMLQKGNLATPYALHPSEVVEKRNIIPEINLNAQGAKIQGDKIKLVAGDEISLQIADTQKKIINANVANNNIIPNTDFWNNSSRFYNTHSTTATTTSGIIGNVSFGKGWFRMVRSDGALSYLWTHNGGRNRFSVSAGKTYTFSVLVAQNYMGNDLNYAYIRKVSDGSQIRLTNHMVSKTRVGDVFGRYVYKYVFTFDVPWTSNNDTVMFFGMNNSAENRAGYYLSEWKLEEGSDATAYTEVYATKEDLVSQINLDSSGANITGNKISLTGTAEFNSAFKDRGITAISGGKIETDQMLAKKIEIERSDARTVSGKRLGVYMNNGMPNSSYDLTRNTWLQGSAAIEWHKQGYMLYGNHMSGGTYYSAETVYTTHHARYLTIGVGYNLDGDSSSVYALGQIYSFGGGNHGTSSTRTLVRKGETVWESITIDLGVPDFSTNLAFYLRFGQSSVHHSNRLKVRINRVHMHG